MPEYNEVPDEVNEEPVAEEVASSVSKKMPKPPVDDDGVEPLLPIRKPSNKKVEVDVMPVNLFSDHYVVVAADGYPDAYLLAKADFDLQPGRQKMEKQVLERAPKAHDFGPVLATLMPSVEDTLRAFYRAGIVDVNTLKQGQRYRNALVRSMPRLGDILAAEES